jgi:ribosome modulation factor
MTWRDQLLSAQDKGRKARRSGRPLRANPYLLNNQLASYWNAGWFDADNDLEKLAKAGKEGE